MVGVSPQAFANWGRADGVKRLPNAETLFMGYSALGLIGAGALAASSASSSAASSAAPSVPSASALSSSSSASSVLRTVSFLLPARGLPVHGEAAADDSGGRSVPEHDDSAPPEVAPRGLSLVPVTGESMRPLVLPGQYVMVDEEREGFPGEGSIVVASVRNPEPEASDWAEPGFVPRTEAVTGTFVKRVYRHGDYYTFASVNPDYGPFDCWMGNVRMWPVVGVWFAGRGTPPSRASVLGDWGRDGVKRERER